MIGLLIGLAAQASLASAPLNPNANELFDRDPDLKAWALRLYDTNRDGWLTLYEAQPACLAFKEIADADRDGRVTTHEYQRAKEFVAARWAVR
jgi:hypothetical protein